MFKRICLLLLLTVHHSHASQKEINTTKDSDWSLCTQAKDPRSGLLCKVAQCIVLYKENRTKEIVEKDLSTAKQLIMHLNESMMPFTTEDQASYLRSLNNLIYNTISIFLKKDRFPLNKLFFEYLPLGVDLPSLSLTNNNNPLKEICEKSAYTEYIPLFMYMHKAKLVWDDTYFLKVMIERYVKFDVKTKSKYFKEILTPRFYDHYSDEPRHYTHAEIAKNHDDHLGLKEKLNTLLLCLKVSRLKIPKPVIKKLIIEDGLLKKTVQKYNIQEEMYPLFVHCDTVKESIINQIESLKKDPRLTKKRWNMEHKLPPFLRSPEAFAQWFEEIKN